MTLVASDPSLKFHSFTRVMVIAVNEMVTMLPLKLYTLYLLCTNPIAPWYSWDYVHDDFMDVVAVPSAVWKVYPDLVVSLEFGHWFGVWMAIVIIGLFGFSRDTYKIYISWFWKVAGRFGLHPRESTASFSTSSFDFKGDMLTSGKTVSRACSRPRISCSRMAAGSRKGVCQKLFSTR